MLVEGEKPRYLMAKFQFKYISHEFPSASVASQVKELRYILERKSLVLSAPEVASNSAVHIFEFMVIKEPALT